MGVCQDRMRFVSDFGQFNTGIGRERAPYFRHIHGFIAGAISGIRQPRPVTLSPYFTRREPGFRERPSGPAMDPISGANKGQIA
jgi:hypothetical protein